MQGKRGLIAQYRSSSVARSQCGSKFILFFSDSIPLGIKLILPFIDKLSHLPANSSPFFLGLLILAPEIRLLIFGCNSFHGGNSVLKRPLLFSKIIDLLVDLSYRLLEIIKLCSEHRNLAGRNIIHARIVVNNAVRSFDCIDDVFEPCKGKRCALRRSFHALQHLFCIFSSKPVDLFKLCIDLFCIPANGSGKLFSNFRDGLIQTFAQCNRYLCWFSIRMGDIVYGFNGIVRSQKL